MSCIKWCWVAAGFFLVGLIMSIVSCYISDVARIVCWLAGAVLNISGWVTYAIAWAKR